MKSLGALLPKYQSGSQTTADCWLVVRTDGQRFGFTDHPESLTIDGDTYEGNAGFDRTANEVAIGLGADNVTLQGIIDSDTIAEEDIIGRKFQDATVHYFTVDYNDPDGPKDKHSFGYIGEITLKGKIWQAEFTSLAVLLEREFGERRTPYCRVKLGSSRCKVTLDPGVWASSTVVSVGDIVKNSSYDGFQYVYTQTGTTGATEPVYVASVGASTTDGNAVLVAAEAFTKSFQVTSVVNTRRTFIASVVNGMSSAWYDFGEAVFSTGNNAGITAQVKSNNASAQVELLFDLPFTVSVGDTGSLVVGCNHKLKELSDTAGSSYTGHCRTKFFAPGTVPGSGNAKNYQGDPEIPGINAILGADSE